MFVFGLQLRHAGYSTAKHHEATKARNTTKPRSHEGAQGFSPAITLRMRRESRYTVFMLKKLGIVVVGLVLVAAALAASGFRIQRGGSGWPRFVAQSNDDVLEANRAEQRQMSPGLSGAAATQSVPEPIAPVAAPTSTAGTPDAALTPASSAGAEAEGSVARPGASWTDFRGPDRDGRYTATPIRTSWPREGLRRLWRQPIGAGYASFVVADGRAYTIEQRRNQEVVAAYDVQTGRELWTSAWTANFQESMGGDGPRATPTYHEGRVYALGGEGELRVLDAAKGTLVWRRNILTENNARNLSWGMSASPLIVDDKVIVLPGGPRGNSVVAYDKLTGNPIWKALNDEAAYTSPMLATIGGVRQILVVSATRAMGLTVDNGALLWEYPWNTFNGINVSQPIPFTHNGQDRIFLSAAYGHGAAVFELTRAGGDRFAAKTVWENQRMKNKFTSSVLHKGHIYGLDESILASVNAETGDQNWKGGRYGYGQIMLAGDHLIVLTEEGDVVLVNATPARHEELARFSAIEGKTWNHPVIAEGRLLVRNLQEMAAFDIQP
jgi:outer membrane protein assembly factor BamB